MKMRREKTRTTHTPCQKKQDRCESLSRSTYLKAREEKKTVGGRREGRAWRSAKSTSINV